MLLPVLELVQGRLSGLIPIRHLQSYLERLDTLPLRFGEARLISCFPIVVNNLGDLRVSVIDVQISLHLEVPLLFGLVAYWRVRILGVI